MRIKSGVWYWLAMGSFATGLLYSMGLEGTCQTGAGREIRRAAQQRRPAKADPVHRPRCSLRTPAGSLQAAVRAGTCSSGSPEGRSERAASSAGAAGSVPETPGRRGAQNAFLAYFFGIPCISGLDTVYYIG